MTCPHAERLQPISVIVVWHGPARPQVVLIEGDFRACVNCEELFDEVDSALTRKGISSWSRALVIAVDGQRITVTRRGPVGPQATA